MNYFLGLAWFVDLEVDIGVGIGWTYLENFRGLALENNYAGFGNYHRL